MDQFKEMIEIEKNFGIIKMGNERPEIDVEVA